MKPSKRLKQILIENVWGKDMPIIEAFNIFMKSVTRFLDE